MTERPSAPAQRRRGNSRIGKRQDRQGESIRALRLRLQDLKAVELRLTYIESRLKALRGVYEVETDTETDDDEVRVIDK